MQELVAIAQTGQGFVETLSRIWERGDALMPLDPRLPDAARDSLIAALAPTRIIEADVFLWNRTQLRFCQILVVIRPTD